MDLSLVAEVGKNLLNQVKEDFGPEWEQLEDLAKDKLKTAAADYSELLLMSLAGDDNVDRELAHAKAAVMSWGFASAMRAQQLFFKALKEVPKMALEAVTDSV